jgi:hypothetical protein
MKNTFTLLLLFISIAACTQKITGAELLDKSIHFYDPNNNWETFEGQLFVTMETPKRTPRKSSIQIDHPKQYFSVEAKRDTIITKHAISKEECSFLMNGNTASSETLKE